VGWVGLSYRFEKRNLLKDFSLLTLLLENKKIILMSQKTDLTGNRQQATGYRLQATGYRRLYISSK
jgi:hypothetical protein